MNVGSRVNAGYPPSTQSKIWILWHREKRKKSRPLKQSLKLPRSLEDQSSTTIRALIWWIFQETLNCYMTRKFSNSQQKTSYYAVQESTQSEWLVSCCTTVRAPKYSSKTFPEKPTQKSSKIQNPTVYFFSSKSYHCWVSWLFWLNR